MKPATSGKEYKCNCGYEQILGELDYIRAVDDACIRAGHSICLQSNK